jgi:hypothetical protein
MQVELSMIVATKKKIKDTIVQSVRRRKYD